MTTAPILQYPNWEKPFILATDASGIGLGAVPEQDSDNSPRRPHPIAYASLALSATDRKYSTADLEGLAVVWACKHFRHYLTFQKFTLITDHEALSYLFTHEKRLGNNRLARYALALQEFDFVIKHRKGAENNVADVLSRNPVGPYVFLRTGAPDSIAEKFFCQSEFDDNAICSPNWDTLNETYFETEVTNNMCPPACAIQDIAATQWREALAVDPFAAPIIRYLKHGTVPENESEPAFLR